MDINTLQLRSKTNLLSARDGIAAVSNYVSFSTIRELQAYYEHLKAAREILITDQQQRSFQKKLDSFVKFVILISKTSLNSEQPFVDE
jgi:hypothetical protein